MANASNKVIAGDYKNYLVSVGFGGAFLGYFLKTVDINKKTVASYELIYY